MVDEVVLDHTGELWINHRDGMMPVADRITRAVVAARLGGAGMDSEDRSILVDAAAGSWKRDDEGLFITLE